MLAVRRIKNPELLIAIGLGLWWIINLFQAGCTELANDEAYYYMFAEHLDWGYFDHPPMVALLVWFGNFIGGELGVRFFFTLLQPVYLYLLWRVIRPNNATLREAWLYLLIASSMPILQLYGFIAVPDGPLMLFTMLLLFFYKRFTEQNRTSDALWMGVALAALAYSKYHGALVLLFIVLSNVRLLRNPRFYLGCLLALVLIFPHLWWQQAHDWVSFRYHLSGRNRAFEINYVIEYLLNLLAIFNPFLFPIFILAWWKSRSATPVLRAMSCISMGFILFFLCSTFRGYVQPQWVIPATFGIVASLWGYIRVQEKLHRYTFCVGGVTLALVLLLRVEMIGNPLGLRMEIFNNPGSYRQLEQLAAGRPVIFGGKYAIAAKYHFYTGEVGYARPLVDFRTSQYQFSNADSLMTGRSVVMEVAPETPGAQKLLLANHSLFAYRIIDPFYPTRQVEIRAASLPESVAPGDTLHLQLTLTNPYPHSFEIDGATTAVNMVWRHLGEKTWVLPITQLTGRLPAQGTLKVEVTSVVPDSLLQGISYESGFMLTNTPAWWWFNGTPTPIKITSHRIASKTKH